MNTTLTLAPLPDRAECRPATVCSWCTTRAELDRLNALYPALSHGMCSACQTTFLEGVKP
jgi:hypothetical protein